MVAAARLLALVLAAALVAQAPDRSVHVAAADGTRLAISVWLPAARGVEGKVPALLEVTRYGRAHVRRDNGAALDELQPEDRAFLAAGYALVKADARGSGASFGSRPMEYGPQEVRDGRALLDWICAQAWCDGKIGAYGVSYSGTTAELLCAVGHSALKAVVVGWSDFDIYTSPARPYGLFAGPLIRAWSKLVGEMDRNAHRRVSVRPVDGDDGGALLTAAVAEHAANPDVGALCAQLEFRDQQASGSGLSLGECSSLAWKKEIEASNVPMLVFASWFDSGTAGGALLRLCHYKNPQHLLILASSHGGQFRASPFATEGAGPLPDPEQQVQLRVQFFDHHLRGVDHGVAQWPKLRYHNLGEEQVRSAEQWPLPGTRRQILYCAPGRTLQAAAPEATGRDDYEVDFGAGTGQWNRWQTQLATPVRHLDQRAASAERLLCYTGEALRSDLQIAGAPVVTVHCSSDQPDGAFLFYLEAVAPDGRARLLTEGGLRAIHRALSPSPLGEPGPWHACTRAAQQPLTPGERFELAVQLWPVAVLVPAGHRLRLAIAGADRDSFDRVPTDATPRLSFFHGPGQQSILDLPVVEPK